MSGLDDVQLTLVNSMEDVRHLWEWLQNKEHDPDTKALGVDSETSGLDLYNDTLRLVQIGDGLHGWAIPWETWSGVFEDVLRHWSKDWILHNAGFDTSFFDRYGVGLPRHKIHDSMVMARINEPHTSMALKAQAARHVDPAAAGLQNELKDTEWTFANVPVTYQPYWLYGALDPVLTYKLWEHHALIIQGECPKAYDIEMGVLWVTQDMERYGMHVDRAYAKQMADKFTQYCKQVEDWCKTEYNVKPGSNAAIIKILQDEGIQFDKRTDSGALSLDAEVIGHIEHPLAQAVLQRRQMQKMVSTYLNHYIHDADANDLMHPSINTLGARTSRMSMSNPNVQNLPRMGTSKPGDAVRNCVTTRYEDGMLIMCDFSQIEMRLLAHFAKEQSMIDAFKSSDDFFVTLAREIFNDSSITKKDPRRQITKNSGYAKIYGAGISKFAQTAQINESQARDFLYRFDMLYPGVTTFQRDMIQEAINNREKTGTPFVRSPHTNRPFVADKGKEYAVTNYVIQGTAAELLKMKLIELSNAGLSEFMFAPVHDEVLLDVPGEHINDVVHTLKQIMNDDTMLSVPLEAEVSWGKRWGEKESCPL